MSKRPTIASLEKRIAELRELREGDRQQLDSLRAQVEYHRQQTSERNIRIDELRKDKEWLQRIISPLAQAIHTRS